MPTTEDLKAAYLKLTERGISPTVDNLVAETGGKKNDVLRVRNEVEATMREERANGEDLSPASKAMAFDVVRIVEREFEERYSSAHIVLRREFESTLIALRISNEALAAENAGLAGRLASTEDEKALALEVVATLRDRLHRSEQERAELKRDFESPHAEPFPQSEPAPAARPEAIDNDHLTQRLVQIERTLERFMSVIEQNVIVAKPLPTSSARPHVSSASKTRLEVDDRQFELDNAISKQIQKDELAAKTEGATSLATASLTQAGADEHVDLLDEMPEELRDADFDGDDLEEVEPTVSVDLLNRSRGRSPDVHLDQEEEDLPEFLMETDYHETRSASTF